MNSPSDHRAAIRTAIQGLRAADLSQGGAGLLAALGYSSPKNLATAGRPSALLDAVGISTERFSTVGGIERWLRLDLIFQLTGDELPALARGSAPHTTARYQREMIDSFVFLALDLENSPSAPWSRRQLVTITRELNRGFAMPAILLFRHDGRATIAVIDRRRNQRDPTRDVVGGRISLIKDIDLANPHRAHVEILSDLALSHLRPAPADFRGLYDGWLSVLSASELNKRFYKDLADWFAWASSPGLVNFPPGQGNGEGERQIGLIRLLTRLMFVWFIKQKRLIPEELFDRVALDGLLTESPERSPDGYAYYLAVLQNLFFASLNTEMAERGWLPRDAVGGTSSYMVHNRYRHRHLFTDPDAALPLFAQVPFLNGGLFDCLDVEVTAEDPRAAKAMREGRRGLVLRVDGFSEEPERQPRLPNRLFFGGQLGADLSAYYGRATRRDVPGLIDIFERYKFTIEENTPLEEEAALDPELLGKVFENLLASYNEDTRTTARNKSGSFYTPREVVDFMVGEALVAYLLPTLAPSRQASLRPRAPGLDFGPAPGELALRQSAPRSPGDAAQAENEQRLRALFGYTEVMPSFTDAEADALVAAIEACRAIDPAVGSGAFPLGLLQKLVHALHRLDPGGTKWKSRNRLPLEDQLEAARRTPALAERAERVADAEAKLAAFDVSFDAGTADYARKLYVIEGCLYGVDIQPIAVQIAKLRCFIALAVEQIVDDAKPNRGITSLPNLEMKFVAANTLGVVASAQGQLRDNRIREKEAALRDANAAFFSARDRRGKRRAQQQIEVLRGELGELLVQERVSSAEDARALAAWNPFDANSAARFFEPEWMFGLEADAARGFFDIVIANPPYVRQEKIESYLVDGQPANPKAKLRETFETFVGTADIYVYFYERAVRLLRAGGAITFITSNKWYRAGYGAKLRNWLNQNICLRSVIDFGDAEVFEAIAYPTIVIGTRRGRAVARPGVGEVFHALNWRPGEPPEHFPERFAAEAFEMPQSALLSTGWQLESQTKRDLLARLRARGTPLAEWCGGRFYYGIKTGLNAAFVIDGAKRAELIAEDPNSAECIEPYVGGRDVKRWAVQRRDKWLIFIPWHFPLPNGEMIEGASLEAEIAFERQYPALYAHLRTFKQALLARDQRETGIRYEWYALQRYRNYWREFLQPKIIIPAIEKECAYAFDGDGFFGNDKTSIVVTPRWRLLLAIANSSVSWWVTKQEFASKQGGFYEFKPMYVGKLPIPPATQRQEELVGVVVNAIIAGADRVCLESLINAFVYELFFADELHARDLHPFATADDAGLVNLADLAGPALVRAAENWSRCLREPDHPLYATLFALQSMDVIRTIEGRE